MYCPLILTQSRLPLIDPGSSRGFLLLRETDIFEIQEPTTNIFPFYMRPVFIIIMKKNNNKKTKP